MNKADINQLKKIISSLSENDLLNKYLNISNKEYEETDEETLMYQIRKTKSNFNMKLPKDTLILFQYDNCYHIEIDGSKDDKCDYYDGIFIGMINDKIDLMQNVDIDVQLKLYQNDGTIEYRDLATSYIKCETSNEICLYTEWRFWLLTTGEQKGFYTDFTQSNAYIIFPTHALYESLKEYYDMPSK